MNIKRNNEVKTINSFLFEMTLQTYKFYVDMDGVITDFDGEFKKFGKGTQYEYEDRQEEFFKILTSGGEKFWSEMKWKKDGKKLWNFIKKYNPIILSAPTRHISSKTGKIKWIKRELGSTQQYILDKDKFKYADKNSILIDDKTDKIESWRKYEGIGILHTSAEDTIEQILELKKE